LDVSGIFGNVHRYKLTLIFRDLQLKQPPRDFL
jgi:hypothetical protein